MITDVVLGHRELAGVHYTGSTRVFQGIWKRIGENIHNYKNYPRLVGETGGKDFIFAHPSAKVDALVAAIIRGAYEYQGQKCSAASRGFIPKSIWPQVKDGLISRLATIHVRYPSLSPPTHHPSLNPPLAIHHLMR
jgi:1-pyrroline-5-carboxylate dehydrogenase